jgi:SWI/SNF-related matrix-associated actin-dependent regulator 1 of chromatin subfamily A
MKVEHKGSRYIACSSYAEREIPKAAGFRWDGVNKYWWTSDPAIAAKLGSEEAIATALVEQKAREVKKEEAVSASRAATSDVELPCPEGLAYLPYQRAGIATALNRPNVLFGDEMGLGKTIQAIGVINADESIKTVLVICPAGLRLNWKREMAKWFTRDMPAVIVSSTSWPEGFAVSIINYDILAKHEKRLHETNWDCVIVDESHYCKNPKAKRTIAVVGRDKSRNEEALPGIQARRRIMLTGTPIPNRPIEGQPLFHWLAPDEYGFKFFPYAKRYAAAYQNSYGWDFSGASNLDELQRKLRSTIMIRRLKADVLTELPAKRRQVVEIPANGDAKVVEAEVRAYTASEERIDALRVAVELAKAADATSYQNAVDQLRDAVQAAFTEMAALRHATALAKVPRVVEHILDSLAEEGHKIVVFSWHRDVIAAICEALSQEKIEAVSVTGDTPMQARQNAVDRFQSAPECRVFVGNIQAAGVGITLTAASHVIFAELDWVPGNITQAEDRCHRIGQRNSVLVQHIVLDGSIDARMAKTLIEKQAVLDAALDRETPEPVAPVTPAREKAATESLTRSKLDDVAAKLTPEQISAIHEGLRILAAVDRDHAATLNGVGYSKIDSGIGHSLAERLSLTPRQAALGQKIVHRYRRQLGTDLIAVADGIVKVQEATLC